MSFRKLGVISFLEHYQKYPCLWFKHDPHYLNSKVRHRAEKKLLKATSIKTLQELQQTVEFILNSYNKEKEEIKKHQEQGIVYKPNSVWFEFANGFLKKNFEEQNLNPTENISTQRDQVILGDILREIKVESDSEEMEDKKDIKDIDIKLFDLKEDVTTICKKRKRTEEDTNASFSVEQNHKKQGSFGDSGSETAKERLVASGLTVRDISASDTTASTSGGTYVGNKEVYQVSNGLEDTSTVQDINKGDFTLNNRVQTGANEVVIASLANSNVETDDQSSPSSNRKIDPQSNLAISNHLIISPSNYLGTTGSNKNIKSICSWRNGDPKRVLLQDNEGTSTISQKTLGSEETDQQPLWRNQLMPGVTVVPLNRERHELSGKNESETSSMPLITMMPDPVSSNAKRVSETSRLLEGIETRNKKMRPSSTSNCETNSLLASSTNRTTGKSIENNSTAENSITQNTAPIEYQNEFVVFGQSIGLQMMKLPLAQALRLQQSIQSLLTEARLKALNQWP